MQRARHVLEVKFCQSNPSGLYALQLAWGHLDIGMYAKPNATSTGRAHDGHTEHNLTYHDSATQVTVAV